MTDEAGGPDTFKLILGLAGRQLAAHVAAGAEVMPCPRWMNPPGLQPWLRGVAVHHSELLPIVDLSALLDARPLPSATEKQRVISVSAGGFRTGFLVASVSEAETMESAGAPAPGQLETLDVTELCLDIQAAPWALVAAS